MRCNRALDYERGRSKSTSPWFRGGLRWAGLPEWGTAEDLVGERRGDDMNLPTAHCPACRTEVLVYRDVARGEEPSEAPLETRCVECDLRLDRFGLDPVLTDRPLLELSGMGYVDLDKAQPSGSGGCFTKGCEGCPKIDSRPW